MFLETLDSLVLAGNDDSRLVYQPLIYFLYIDPIASPITLEVLQESNLVGRGVDARRRRRDSAVRGGRERGVASMRGHMY